MRGRCGEGQREGRRSGRCVGTATLTSLGPDTPKPRLLNLLSLPSPPGYADRGLLGATCLTHWREWEAFEVRARPLRERHAEVSRDRDLTPFPRGDPHHIVGVGALPISSFLKKRVSKLLAEYCDKRTPASISDQLELRFRPDGNSVVLYERRPHWKRPGEWTEGGVAKFRYFVGRQKWALYCRDRYERWHRYDLIDESVLFDDVSRGGRR